jgi:hypothetical protein
MSGVAATSVYTTRMDGGSFMSSSSVTNSNITISTGDLINDGDFYCPTWYSWYTQRMKWSIVKQMNTLSIGVYYSAQSSYTMNSYMYCMRSDTAQTYFQGHPIVSYSITNVGNTIINRQGNVV